MRRILLPLALSPLVACTGLQKAQVPEPAVQSSDQALTIRLDNKTVAQIRADGRVTVAAGVSNHKASQLFWASVMQNFPFQPMYEKLTLENIVLMERLVAERGVVATLKASEPQKELAALKEKFTAEQKAVTDLKKELKALQSQSKKVVKETPQDGKDQRERAGEGSSEAGGREGEPVDRTDQGSPEGGS